MSNYFFLYWNFFCLFSLRIFFIASALLEFFYGDIFTRFNLSGLLVSYIYNLKSYFFFSLESWWTIIYTVSRSMNLFPIFLFKLINIHVILLLSNILNTTKHENIVIEIQHWMSTTLWWGIGCLFFLPLLIGQGKFPEII